MHTAETLDYHHACAGVLIILLSVLLQVCYRARRYAHQTRAKRKGMLVSHVLSLQHPVL